MMLPRAAGVAAAVVLVLTGATTSGAAAAAATSHRTWYASPKGRAKAACTTKSPCSLPAALGKARNGDTVLVLPGTYGTAKDPLHLVTNDSYAFTLEGELTSKPPVIFTDTQTRLDAPNAGSVLRHLVVHNIDTQAGTSAIYMGNADAVVEDVYASSTQGNACVFIAGTAVDTVCFAAGAGVDAINADNYSAATDELGLDGVDAIAAGQNSFGLHAYAYGGSQNNFQIYDSLFDAAGDDVWFDAGSSSDGDEARITFDHSDFVTYAEGSGTGTVTVVERHDISARPDLKNVYAGQLQELPSSMTIDAGNSKVAPPTDLAGHQRTAGNATDIGAYEYQPPPRILKTTYGSGKGSVRATVSVDTGRLPTVVRLVAKRSGDSATKVAHLARGALRRTGQVTITGLARHEAYRLTVTVSSAGGHATGRPASVRSG